MTGHAPLVRAVAAHGLAGTTTTWPSEPLTTAGFTQLLGGVRQQRLSGLLVEAIGRGDLPASDAQAATAGEAHFEAICDVLLLEAAVLRTVGVLESAGVEPRILKGTGVAHLDYPDPSLRLFGDVDLIVRGEEFDAAVAALTAEGHTRRYPQPRPGFDRRFSKGTSFRTEQGVEIDLHRTFVMGPYGLRVDLDSVWRTSTPFELGGRILHALDPEMRFLHACYHAALGDVVPRLVPQRDVAQMLLSDRLDLDRVERLMRAWEAQPVVARAVRLAWTNLELADITGLSAWAERYVPDARAERELAVYADPGGGYAGRSLAALGAIPGVRAKAAFALALAFPDRGYVEGRHAGRTHRWRTGAKAALRRRQDQT